MAVVFLLLGLFMLYQALQLPVRTLDGGPGPGILPVGLALLLVGFSVWILARRRREQVHFGNTRRVGIMTLGVFVYAFLLERLGFIVTTSLLMVALMVAFNERRRLPLAALGLVGTAASFVLFYNVLKVQLPVDPWGLWR
jgi:putative tricarboxylic transport membrane protein